MGSNGFDQCEEGMFQYLGPCRTGDEEKNKVSRKLNTI